MRDAGEFENKDGFVKRREGARVFNDRPLTPEEAAARGREIERENERRRERRRQPRRLKGWAARRAGREGRRL